MSLRLHLLGQFRVERDGRPIDLSVAKAVALLAYLALASESQSRERVLVLLWPESSGDAARKNLRNTLWSIRRALGEDAVQADGDRLAIDPAAWVDVRELERAADGAPVDEALLWAGTGVLLDGFTLAEAPDFDLWLTAERERVVQLVLRVLSGRAEASRMRGDWPALARTAQRALSLDSLQEPMHRLLMEGYARMGERAEALRQYDRLRGLLDSELGVEPLPETQALRDAILAGEYDTPSAIPHPIPSLEAPRRPRRQPILGDVPRTPFVGRVAECAVLDTEMDNAARGHARVVLITGEMGIGKSRLWHEWSARLVPETIVLQGRCLEVTQSLPFAPMIDLFGQHACVRQLTAQPSALSPIWLAELARVIPAIHAALPALPVPVALPLEDARQRLFEAFAQLLLAIPSRPLILFIDDLHWADQATLDWLRFAVHRLHSQPLLIVGAYRPEDASSALARLAAAWARDGVLQRLPLHRLSSEESSALIAALGGDTQMAQRAQTQSAGNPYFLIELCRAAPADVPPVLSDLIRARLDRLPEMSRQVLQAAAVLGQEMDFLTLRRTSGRGEEETLDALDALLAAAVLVERGGRYAFTHPLVADVVHSSLSRARRAFLHRRAAEAIEVAHAGRLDSLGQVAAQLATHYAEANEPQRAAQFADMAARRAMALAAPAEAIELYRRALALDPMPERQMWLGQALQRSNEINGARAAFEQALHGYVARGDHRGAARASLELGAISLPAGRYDEVVRWADTSLTYLDAEADPEAHARAHFLLGAGRLQGGGAMSEAELHLAEASRLAAQHQLPGLASQSYFELGNLLAQRGDLDGALRAYADAIDAAHKSDDPLQEAMAHNNLAYHALLAGKLALAHEHIDQALALVDAGAIQMPRQYLYSTRGEIALAEQQWDDAEEWFRKGMAEAEKAGNVVQAANYQANLALAAQGRGDLDAALVWLESAQQAAAPLTAPHLQAQIDVWLCDLYLRRGERVAAREALNRAEARIEEKGYGRLRSWAALLRAQLG